MKCSTNSSANKRIPIYFTCFVWMQCGASFVRTTNDDLFTYSIARIGLKMPLQTASLLSATKCTSCIPECRETERYAKPIDDILFYRLMLALWSSAATHANPFSHQTHTHTHTHSPHTRTTYTYAPIPFDFAIRCISRMWIRSIACHCVSIVGL